MKTLSFNTLKPLAFTALFIVFAASFNTAEAGGYPNGHACQNGAECASGRCSDPEKGQGTCLEAVNW